jgi:solute carrier family 13 (sodium-dependent dicarboxylate transporter), member 2/3/5
MTPHSESPPSSRLQLVGLVAGLAILLLGRLVAPPGMSNSAWSVATVAMLMAVWWITQPIPIPATALLPLVLFPLLGTASIDAVAGSYANPVIFLFLGGFLIAAALQECGLHRRMALTIISIVGCSPSRVVAGFMGATAFVSLWVSNTATVAMFLPLTLSVIDLVDRSVDDVSEKRSFAIAILLGISAAANIGGLGTLIGTPPNALLAAFMMKAYGVEIGFAEWMLIGIPLVIVALPIAWFLLTRVLFRIGIRELPGGQEMVRTELEALGGLSREEMLVGAITALAAAGWMIRPLLDDVVPGISDAGIAVTAGVLLFLIPSSRGDRDRTLDWTHAERLPWGVLVLFGGGLALADGIQQSGLAIWIGSSLEGLRDLPPYALVLIVTTLLVILTELASNTAIAATLLPIVGSLAIGIGANPMLLAVPTALGASCGFALPVGTPPNAMVFGTGRMRVADMVRAGVVLDVVMIVLVTIATLIWV